MICLGVQHENIIVEICNNFQLLFVSPKKSVLHLCVNILFALSYKGFARARRTQLQLITLFNATVVICFYSVSASVGESAPRNLGFH